jgi:hypothetical protein
MHDLFLQAAGKSVPDTDLPGERRGNAPGAARRFGQV